MLDFRFQSFEFAHVGTINASGGEIVNKRGEGRGVLGVGGFSEERLYHNHLHHRTCPPAALFFILVLMKLVVGV